MNGPTAIKTLRTLGFDLPIIGLTGNILQEDVDTFLTHGANAVVPKPLTIIRLSECLLHMTKKEFGNIAFDNHCNV